MLGFLNKRPVLVTKVHFRTKVSIFGIPIPINRRKYPIISTSNHSPCKDTSVLFWKRMSTSYWYSSSSDEYASPINCRAQPWLDGIPRVWSVHLQIRFPLRSAAARLLCCCVSLSIPLSLLMLLSWGLTCIFEPACVDLGITISNFTKLKAGGVLYCGLPFNGGSLLGPLESDIPVMLLDSLLKRFASLKMSMKDYIWHTYDIHLTYMGHTYDILHTLWRTTYRPRSVPSSSQALSLS